MTYEVQTYWSESLVFWLTYYREAARDWINLAVTGWYQ